MDTIPLHDTYARLSTDDEAETYSNGASVAAPISLATLRERVLEGQIPLQAEAHYVERWGCWVEIRELTGYKRAMLFDQNMDSNGKLQNKTLYPHLVIASC